VALAADVDSVDAAEASIAVVARSAPGGARVLDHGSGHRFGFSSRGFWKLAQQPSQPQVSDTLSFGCTPASENLRVGTYNRR